MCTPLRYAEHKEVGIHTYNKTKIVSIKKMNKIMKKEYVSPEMDVLALELEGMIAVSTEIGIVDDPAEDDVMDGRLRDILGIGGGLFGN